MHVPISTKTLNSFLLVCLIFVAGNLQAQRNMDDVQIEATKVADNIHMLQGAGGNMAVVTGDDGAFLIDDQYAPLTDKIMAAIQEIHSGPVKFILNTHWHGDHTGGNENLGKAGSVIVAHDNVRTRMSSEHFNELFDRTTQASPKEALPIITFSQTVTFHLNDEEIFAFHVPPAHTDGDAIIHFKNANVIHMGDIMFNGMYPFIDHSSGGSVRGVINAVERVLKLCDERTKIIPGHGALADKKALEDYHVMLTGVVEAVTDAMTGGKTYEQVLAADPLKCWNDAWGGGFMKPDVFLKIVYADLSGGS